MYTDLELSTCHNVHMGPHAVAKGQIYIQWTVNRCTHDHIYVASKWTINLLMKHLPSLRPARSSTSTTWGCSGGRCHYGFHPCGPRCLQACLQPNLHIHKQQVFNTQNFKIHSKFRNLYNLVKMHVKSYCNVMIPINLLLTHRRDNNRLTRGKLHTNN